MSVKIEKKFDIIMSEMDEMMDEIINNQPSHLSLNVCGIMREFDGVSITLLNGYLKINGADMVEVIKYRDICGWSIRDFKKADDVSSISPAMEINVDEIRDEILNTPSKLPQTFLKREIPHDIKHTAVISFMAEYNGCSREEMEREIKDDEWERDTYDCYMKLKTYGDLNSSMADYLAYFWYDDELIRERMEEGDDISSMLWINDVITHHIPSHLYEGDDVDD